MKMSSTFRTISALIVGTLGAATIPSGAGAAVPECSVGQLSARLIPGSPGAGQRYATLALTNRSSRTCRTGGYVGLGLQSATGRPVPTQAVRRNEGQVRTLLLAPRASATSQLHWSDVPGTGDRRGGSCYVAPRSVLITPPNARRSLSQTWHGGTVCERGRIDITPLTAS